MGVNGEKIKKFILDNTVTIVFLGFVVFGFIVSDTFTPSSFTNDIISRFFRNGVLVLALIIPIMAGLGLNFGIVVGALAGVLSIVFVRYHYTLFPGIGGLLLCFVIATPIAILFGWLTGKLYNKTRGQEMVASLIVSFFADGLYQIFLLFVVGAIIPVRAGHRMINPGERGIGIRSSFEMGLPAEEMTGRGFADEIPGMARALNNLWRVEFVYALVAVSLAVFIFLVVRRIYMKRHPEIVSVRNEHFWAFCLKIAVCGAVLAFAIFSSGQIYYWYNVLQDTPEITRLDLLPGISNFAVEVSRIDRVPVVTGLVIGAIGLFIVYFSKTKLGQDCRSVGQNQQIATVSGIDVDRTRIIATIISTVIAAWGMIIFLQDMGHISTYTVYRNIGFFSVAAILVGGATAAKASVKNAMVGLILFHAMFVVSPAVGMFLFNDGNAGEYMRTFMAYGVIGVSLGLYVWKANKAAKDKEKLT
ncbi:MAG: ABC transporter permease [Defluviitaleaceae bacterium]|nr:ABC transporter permease [Defluviitaleaceae bacterium]